MVLLAGSSPIRLRTATCCAESRIPKTEITRLQSQRAATSQYALETVFQEKEPMTAAARMVHWDQNASASRGLDIQMANR